MESEKDKRYTLRWCLFCLFLGGVFGVSIGYYYGVGYELGDFFKYLINKLSDLLQSFAFVIFAIVLLFRKSLKSLVEKICDNWKSIMEAIIKKRIEEQVERPEQRVPATKTDGLGEIKI